MDWKEFNSRVKKLLRLNSSAPLFQSGLNFLGYILDILLWLVEGSKSQDCEVSPGYFLANRRNTRALLQMEG